MTKKPVAPADPVVTTLYQVEYPVAVTTVAQAINGPYSEFEQYTAQENAEKRHTELLHGTAPHINARPDLIVLRKLVVTAPVVTVLRQGNWRNEEVA